MNEINLSGYLFVAISGGRGNEWAPRAILETVELNGGQILDPHVTDMKKNSEMKEKLGEKGLRDYDMEKIAQAKFGVGDVSDPSTGVGMEIGKMLFQRNIPVLALRYAETNYRSIVVAYEDDPNYYFEEYRTPDELTHHVTHFMRYVKDRYGLER